MGMTHYWQRPTELAATEFARAVEDCRIIAGHVGVPLAGLDGDGAPEFTTDTIIFNGRGHAKGEPFEIHQTEFDRRGRAVVTGYCKTGNAPYDLTVRVSLIVLNHYLGNDFRVTSDSSDHYWAIARSICGRHLGYGEGFKLATE